MIVNSAPPNALIAAYAASTHSTTADAQKKSAETGQAADNVLNDDSVNFSGIAAKYINAIDNNAPYFPVRTAMSADTIILGVAQPGAISSSKNKTFVDVAIDARKSMDEKYALMKASGKPYDKSIADRNALLGDLDRRSLNAVATNQGGRFTAEEQTAAQDVMHQQTQLATGYYVGPEDQEKNWRDPFANDPVGRVKAALNFMDNMSSEEKSAPQWLSQRMTLQSALDQYSAADPVELAKKKHLHFPILAEILQSGSSWLDKKQSDLENDERAQMLKTLQAMIQCEV